MTLIRLIQGDIVGEKGISIAIVNAANVNLRIGGGVAGAIGRACGVRELQKECYDYIQKIKNQLKLNSVPVGSLAITSAHGMHPTEAIVHAVAPYCAKKGVRTGDQALQLKAAYESTFEAAGRNNYHTISMPFLGAGLFNYPHEESAELALTCALNKCPSRIINEIRFVSTDDTLIAHLSKVIGGTSITIDSPLDAQRIINRIPQSTLAIVGLPSNHVDIDRSLQYALDPNRMRTGQNRMQVPPPPPPSARAPPTSTFSLQRRLNVIVEEKKRTIEVQAVKKTLKAEVDGFIVFGECIDQSLIQLDLGPLEDTNIRDDLIAKLRETGVSECGWKCVSIPIQINDNPHPRVLICVTRQTIDASLKGFVETMLDGLTDSIHHPPLHKVAIIVPTNSIFSDIWRVICPVFVLLGAWIVKNETTIEHAILLCNTTDADVARRILRKKSNFTVGTIHTVLASIERNDGLLWNPCPTKGFVFGTEGTVNALKECTPRRFTLPLPRRHSTLTPSVPTTPSQRETDSPGITQIFRELATVEQPNPIGRETEEIPMEIVPVNHTTVISMGTLTDIADEEGCILCIPIDNSLLLECSDLTLQLRASCGEEFEEELRNVDKMIEERGIKPEDIDGWIIPLYSRNLRQFKAIFLMVNVTVNSTSRPTDQEKWRLHCSYQKMMECAKMLKCNRLVVTVSSAQSLGFRIEDATAIAFATVLESCSCEIPSIHFSLNAQGARKLLRDRIFSTSTNLTISDSSEGLLELLNESEGVFSQSSQRVDLDPDDFGGIITISAEEEDVGSQPIQADGRVVFAGRELQLQTDLSEFAGANYTETLNHWVSTHAKEVKARRLSIGLSLLTSSFNMETYEKGISHIVIRNNKAQRPTESAMRETREAILKALQLLEDAGAKEVVINAPTAFFSERYASVIVILAVINHINRNTSIRSIRHYRIVNSKGRCLDELKAWLKNAKEVKCRADVQNLVDRIVQKRTDGRLEQEETGEVNMKLGERRRSRTKETPSEESKTNYKARYDKSVRDMREEEEKRLFYKEDYARREIRKSNNITWEMCEKYKTMKITPKMKNDFYNALKMLLIMRSKPECAYLLRRYKYISRRAVDTLNSLSKRKPRKKKLLAWTVPLAEANEDRKRKRILRKVWKSLRKRPEFLHQMSSLSIIFKILESGKSGQSSIEETVSHYQYLLDAAREIRNVGAKAAESEARKILQQLNRTVLKLEGSSEDENLIRRIGRLRYHISPRDYEGKKVPMVDGIDRLMREWRGVEAGIDNMTEDVAIEEADPSILPDGEHQPPEIPGSLQPSQCTAAVEVERGVDDPNVEASMEEPVNDENEEMEDVEEREERVAEINNRLSTVPRDVMQEAQDEVANIISQEPDMQDHGPAIPEIILPFTTYIHFCEEAKCPQLTADNCRFIIEKVNGYLDLLQKEDFAKCNDYFEKMQEGEVISALDLLKNLAPCYSGIRSILNRYYKIRSSIRAMRRGHRALKGNRIDHLRVQLNEKMPKEIRDIVNQTLSVLYRAEQGDFKEGKIRMQYAEMIKNFNREMDRLLENKICLICHTYTNLIESTKTTKFPVEQYVRDESIGDSYCDKCRKAIRDKKTNQLRIPENGYETSETPAELTDLNWIERLLIQRTRPVVNTVQLCDKGGRKTRMKGTKGGLLLLPVPTEGTLMHVATTLPSAANLRIIVSNNTKKTIVSMERVIRALKFLKIVHPEYADVKINENFTIPRECIVGDGADTVQLIAKDSSDPTLIQHDDITPHIIQDVGGEGKMMKGTGYEHYKLKKNPYFPISLKDRNSDIRAFPWLFPDGQFGFHHPRPRSKDDKVKEHTERDIAQFQLKFKDRRFASDPSFLSFVHGYLEGKTLLSSIGIRAKMSKGKLTTTNFLRMLEDGGTDFQANMSTIAAALRGRNAYWVDTRKTLQSHISTFGPPTWFVTLNPAEWDWPDVVEIYRTAYPNDTIDKNNIRDWIAKDPFFFARRFQNRLSAVMRELLLKEGGPLGTITHFFHRIEYQQRGTQHVHMLLWAKDAPSKDATEQEKLAYISKYVTARLPSEKTEPELHRIITQYQTHHKDHSKTCMRVVRYGRKVVKKCRFDFPRPAIPAAKFNKAARDLADVPGTFKKGYYLARKKGDEQLINDYCPVLSLLWGANTDVQYITDLPHIVPYLTSYTSKGESGKSGSAMQDALRNATDNREAHRVLHEMLRMRETGALEMIDVILGHALHSFDSSHVFINTNDQESRHRILRNDREILECEMAFKDNMYDIYYPNRPEEMEEISLFQCLTHFTTDKGGGSLNSEPASSFNKDYWHPYGNPYRFHYHHLNSYSQFYDFEDSETFPTSAKFPIAGTKNKEFRRVRKPVIGRFFFPHLDSANDESREDYYRRLCMAFIPWRDEKELLSAIPGHIFECYSEMWNHFTESLKNGSEDEQEALKDLEQLIRHHTFLLNAQAETYKNREEMRKRMAALEEEENPEEGDLMLFEREVNEERMERNIGQMNEGQKTIYNEILKRIDDQEEYKSAVKEINNDASTTVDEKKEKIDELNQPEPVRIVISGTAGTGKSFLINNLADYLTVKYCEKGQSAVKAAVCISAPTGIAAVQIRGSTIHALFKIEVQKGASAALKDLEPQALQENRALLNNVRLFIIDEMSMVSNVLLAKINLRLQEIYSNSEPFGGRNLLLLGDLMQLPPVRASKIFENLMEFEIMKLFGGGVIPTANFFNIFGYRELTENMRQKADANFGNIMLNARVQALTEVDVKNLHSCIIDSDSGGSHLIMEEAAQFYVNKQTASAEEGGDPAILALFATNAEVDVFNQLVMKTREMEIIEIPASDSASMKTNAGNAQKRDRHTFARPYQAAENDLADSSEAAARRKKYSRRRSKGKHAFTDAEEDSNITAGLPKLVRVAINGRVMLRRNINPSNGLVNGATGTLIDVVRSLDDEIRTLLIKFDGIEDAQSIERMTATFEVGLDDLISRTQFPIVSAFAATVHKCQGLTLQNVLISTRTFFAPGMAFVAFSRVTSMKGLHLMDFHPNKVWCDLVSLRKYNDLRHTIGLPPFDLPKPRRKNDEEIEAKPRQQPQVIQRKSEPVAETPTTSRRRKMTVEEGDSEGEKRVKRPSIDKTPVNDSSKRTRVSMRKVKEMNDPNNNDASDVTSANSSPEKRKRTKVNGLKIYAPVNLLPRMSSVAVEPCCLSPNGYKLGYRFLNRGTDCFAITAVNSIFCLQSLMGDLALLPGKNHVVDMLLDTYTERRQGNRLPMANVQPIRDYFFNDQIQHDSSEMIERIIDNFQLRREDGSMIQDDFRVAIEMKLPCVGCNQLISWKSNSFFSHLLAIGYVDDTPGTIEQLLERRAIKASFDNSHAPSQCRMNALDVSKEIEIIPHDMPKYLIVALEGEVVTRDAEDNVIRTHHEIPLNGINAKDMRIFDVRYRMRGAVQYKSAGAGESSAGHYVFWWKTPKNWSIVNNNRYLDPARQLPNRCKEMRVLIFEKFE